MAGARDSAIPAPAAGITTRNCSQIFGDRPLAARQTAAALYWSRPLLSSNERPLVVCCSIITVLPNLPPLCSLKLETQEIKAGPGSPLSRHVRLIRAVFSLFSDPAVPGDMILCSGNCCGFILQAQIERIQKTKQQGMFDEHNITLTT